jgi:predicted MPP superfamily phosphohydrolase
MTNGPTHSAPKFPRSIRFGLCLALAIAAYANLVRWLLRPLHAQGLGQPVLGFLNGLDHLFQAPGFKTAAHLGLHSGHHLSLTAWFFSLCVNSIGYFLVGLLLGAVWQWASTRMSRPPAPSRSADSRRRFLRTGMQLVGGGAAAGLGYALVLEPRWFQVTHQVLPIRDLPESLHGLRIVQLTDIHHGPWLALSYVREVIDAANSLEADLILLTGDYVHHSPAYIQPVAAELARLRAKIGTLAVLGNHDWWEDGPLMAAELAHAGIPTIDHDRRILTPERRLVRAAPRGLAIAGVGDLWQDPPDYRRALAGLPPAMPRLLLSHNPDVAEEPGLVHGGRRVDFMLSGHTHGGQIAIPFVGTPITPSRFGQKYAQGFVRGPVCPVFVCRGIGVSMLPLRAGVPPEIAVLELQRLS